MTQVKVCGIRSIAAGRAALQAGATLLGFVFWPYARRYVAPADAAHIIASLRRESWDWSAVGVFVDPTPDEVAHASSVCGLDYIQLSGSESADLIAAMPRPTIKVIQVRAGQEAHAAKAVRHDELGAHMYLLDTHAETVPGGSGVPFNWHALRSAGPRSFVAGGLSPDNVATALSVLTPLGVDVSSGVEFPSGGKDPRLIRAFLEAVRKHDRSSD
jgi:phosphoribosylanthranilate isomerase